MSDKRARLEAELVKIRQAIAAQEALRGTLADQQLETILAALGHKKAELIAQLDGTGSIAQGEGSIAVTATESGTAIGRVQGNVYIGPQPQDPEEALKIYRWVVFQASGALPLRGIDLDAGDPSATRKPLHVANIYIDLDTTSQKSRERSELHTSISQESSLVELLQKAVSDPVGLMENNPLSVLEAVITNRRLILLGDPGGGKTTFVKHLAYCLVGSALEPDRHWLVYLPNWPQAEARILPVLVVLRDFAHFLADPLPKRAEPSQLWDFIVAQLKARNLDFVIEPISQVLETGQAIILLDGLDEIPALSRRVFVRDAVSAFMMRYPHNRYLVTCRNLSYQPPLDPDEPDLRLAEDVPSFELALFDEAKIDDFISAWYAELTRLGTVRGEDQNGLTLKLQAAIRRPDLWRLAPNPLLLTVMALVHAHQGHLPDARALLYEETIDILLWRWDQIKTSGDSEIPPLRKLLLEAGRTDVDLKQALARLAYEAQIESSEGGSEDALFDIGELALKSALISLKKDDYNWTYQLIEVIKLRAGLLLERAPSVYVFPHRTFQEYLAGAHLASLASFPQQATRLAEQGALWREVILLAVGRLVYRLEDTSKSLHLAAELCPLAMKDDEISWYKVWLAGDVLLEIGLNRVADQTLGVELLERVRHRLAALLTEGHLTFQERARAGDTLAYLGDPRPCGVEVSADATRNETGRERPVIPDLEFCYVPAGPFWMGGEETEQEKPPGLVDLTYGYWIGRFPVTTAQMRTFVSQSGYQVATTSSLQGLPNHPVRYVTWYDALAFCEWLTELWHVGEPHLFSKPLPRDFIVTLPTEAEWEKAARGGLQIPVEPVLMSVRAGLMFGQEKARRRENKMNDRRYPWGDSVPTNRANYGYARIGNTTAVGCFPSGASPYDCLDMAGNVWEWTRSLWGTDFEKPDFFYPYRSDDGRENIEANDDTLRVLRGGSTANSHHNIRCATRHGDYPRRLNNLYGFRVSISPR